MIIFCHGHLAYGSPDGGAPYWYDRRGTVVPDIQQVLDDQEVHFMNVALPRWWSRDLSVKCHEVATKELDRLMENLMASSVHIVTHSLGCHVGESIASQLRAQDVPLGQLIHVNPYRYVSRVDHPALILRCTNDWITGKWIKEDIENAVIAGYESKRPWYQRHKEPLYCSEAWSNLATYLR